MAGGRTSKLSQWRALAGLLWSAAPRQVALLAVIVLAVGLLPTAVIVATGVLIDAVPGVLGQDPGGPGARRAMLALALLAAGLAVVALAGNSLNYVARTVNFRYQLRINESVARITLGVPEVALLETPAFADDLSFLQDAERRGLIRRTVPELCNVVILRLRGAGAFVLLLGFSWWAPLLLSAAWYLTNVVYLRSTEKGASVEMTDGAIRVRRSEYLRGLAVDLAAAKEIRIFGLGAWAVEEYSQAWREALQVMWSSRAANRLLSALAALSLVVSHVVVVGAIGWAAYEGRLGVAALFVMVQAVIATSDLGLIGDSQWWLMRCLGVAQRVEELRDRFPAELRPAPFTRPTAERGSLAIRMRDVHFTYTGREQPTLERLNLTIPAGQSLAIVGENGAGKSTVIKLLCGLYRPGAGEITYDGTLTPLEARRRIGVIFQDFVRYHLPLRENVAFGHLPLMGDPEALDRALRDAGGGELLHELPDGWDTVLSRSFVGGVDLSGGQWQRVALARALAAVQGGAGLLILDEPTASLDVRSETELFHRFLELTRGVTTILVSHRLSSVRLADRIVVLRDGRVAEDGSHDELMRAGGSYATMFTLQAERFAAAQELAEPVAQEVADA